MSERAEREPDVGPRTSSPVEQQAPIAGTETGRAPATDFGDLIIQTKLSVGPAGDAYEREADAVADRIVRSINAATPSAGDQSKATPKYAPHDVGPGRVRRAATIGAAGGAVDADTEQKIQSARPGGKPLADQTRRAMESAFGTDLGAVRVHEGPRAADLNNRIQAKAFTTGNDIFFRDGVPDASTRGGQHLLAHELTHTLQQGGGVRRLWAGRQQGRTSDDEQDAPQTAVIRRDWDPQDGPALTTLLKLVTGKPSELVNGLTDAEKQSVKAYLEHAATDHKAVKKLLHFAKRERGETVDAAQRLSIRCKLLVFVANGGTLGDAVDYRSEWLGHSTGHLGDLQPVPSATGEMTMVPMLGGLGVPPENEGLTQGEVQQIRDVFDEVMQNVMYNSSTIPLDFMHQVEQARKADPSARIADVFNTYAPGNDALTGAAGGADCVGMAALVKARLANLGIGCHVIGSASGNYLNQLPSHTRDRVGWQESKDYAVYSHASVVVPYVDLATGEPRAIHIETGMGPEPRHFKSFLTLAEAGGALSQKYDTATDVDPAELAKKHVKVKWRMYLSDSADQASKVFVDLISGSVFLSKRPVADIQGLQGLQDAGMFEGTSFNFESALKTPDRVVTITTADGDVDLTNSDATELFFQLVAQNFKLPDSFVPQMLYLAQNIAEFRQEAMLDPITTIRSTWAKREEALAEQKAASSVRGSKDAAAQSRGQWDTAKGLMKEALAAVNEGDEQAAVQKYDEAINCYGSIVEMFQ